MPKPPAPEATTSAPQKMKWLQGGYGGGGRWVYQDGSEVPADSRPVPMAIRKKEVSVPGSSSSGGLLSPRTKKMRRRKSGKSGGSRRIPEDESEVVADNDAGSETGRNAIADSSHDTMALPEKGRSLRSGKGGGNQHVSEDESEVVADSISGPNSKEKTSVSSASVQDATSSPRKGKWLRGGKGGRRWVWDDEVEVAGSKNNNNNNNMGSRSRRTADNNADSESKRKIPTSAPPSQGTMAPPQKRKGLRGSKATEQVSDDENNAVIDKNIASGSKDTIRDQDIMARDDTALQELNSKQEPISTWPMVDRIMKGDQREYFKVIGEFKTLSQSLKNFDEMLAAGTLKLSRGNDLITDPAEMKSEAKRLYYQKKARLGAICMASGYKLAPCISHIEGNPPKPAKSVKGGRKTSAKPTKTAARTPKYGAVTGILLLEPEEMFEIIREEDEEEFQRTGVRPDRSDYEYRGVKMMEAVDEGDSDDDDDVSNDGDVMKLFAKVDEKPFDPKGGIPVTGSNFTWTNASGEPVSGLKGKGKGKQL